jgi:Cu-processing system permease protein
LFNFLLLLNPADAFRMLNLAGVEDIRVAAGLLGAEMAGGLALSGALVSLLVWTLLPLGLAVGIFHRKSL